MILQFHFWRPLLWSMPVLDDSPSLQPVFLPCCFSFLSFFVKEVSTRYSAAVGVAIAIVTIMGIDKGSPGVTLDHTEQRAGSRFLMVFGWAETDEFKAQEAAAPHTFSCLPSGTLFPYPQSELIDAFALIECQMFLLSVFFYFDSKRCLSARLTVS